MSLISKEDEIQLLKNLLDDPDDWVSAKILQIASDSEQLKKERKAEKASKVVKFEPK